MPSRSRPPQEPDFLPEESLGRSLCQRAGVCREQDCRLGPRNPQMWLAPGGAARWFLGIVRAPHRSSGKGE